VTDPDLHESAWQRAKRDAAGVYTSSSFWVVVTIVGLLATGFSVLATAGESDTTHRVVVPILSGIIALSVVLLLVLAVQFAAASGRQRNELRAAWQAPEIETINVGLTLRNLHRKGTELLHRFADGIGRPGEEEIEQWADGVVAFLSKQVPEQSTQAFLVAGESESSAVPRLRARLQALQEIIDGLG
jgi:hypothetical protein